MGTVDNHVSIIASDQYRNTVLTHEAVGCGILDSGCSKSVCGADWLEAYLDSLNEEEIKEVKYKASTSQFKFGNAQVFKSIHKVIFPAVIGSKKIFIGADVICTEIPLLLSENLKINR